MFHQHKVSHCRGWGGTQGTGILPVVWQWFEGLITNQPIISLSAERTVAIHDIADLRHSENGGRELPLLEDKDDMVIIYNRVPKTGSTSFTNIAYDLCAKNNFHVLHINTTKNNPIMSLQDQVRGASCSLTALIEKRTEIMVSIDITDMLFFFWHFDHVTRQAEVLYSSQVGKFSCCSVHVQELGKFIGIRQVTDNPTC